MKQLKKKILVVDVRSRHAEGMAGLHVQLQVPLKHERDCLWSKEEDSLGHFGGKKSNDLLCHSGRQIWKLKGGLIISDILINNVGEEQHSYYLFDLPPPLFFLHWYAAILLHCSWSNEVASNFLLDPYVICSLG